MRRYSRGMAHLTWGMAGFLVVAFLAAWLVMYLIRDQKTPREPLSHACKGNIETLIQAQIKWAESHDEAFAKRFSDLYPEYISSLRTFQCPSKISEPLFDAKEIDDRCDYEMVKGLGTDAPGERIFIYDKEGNHKHARNVGFVNGKVEEIHEFKFRKMLEEQKNALLEGKQE